MNKLNKLCRVLKWIISRSNSKDIIKNLKYGCRLDVQGFKKWS